MSTYLAKKSSGRRAGGIDTFFNAFSQISSVLNFTHAVSLPLTINYIDTLRHINILF
jgi:hypothetical protein